MFNNILIAFFSLDWQWVYKGNVSSNWETYRLATQTSIKCCAFLMSHQDSSHTIQKYFVYLMQCIINVSNSSSDGIKQERKREEERRRRRERKIKRYKNRERESRGIIIDESVDPIIPCCLRKHRKAPRWHRLAIVASMSPQNRKMR